MKPGGAEPPKAPLWLVLEHLLRSGIGSDACRIWTDTSEKETKKTPFSVPLNTQNLESGVGCPEEPWWVDKEPGSNLNLPVPHQQVQSND